MLLIYTELRLYKWQNVLPTFSLSKLQGKENGWYSLWFISEKMGSIPRTPFSFLEEKEKVHRANLTQCSALMSSGAREGVVYFPVLSFFSRRKEGSLEEGEGRGKQSEAWKFTSALKPFLRLWVRGTRVWRSEEDLQDSLSPPPPPSWWALGIELRQPGLATELLATEPRHQPSIAL